MPERKQFACGFVLAHTVFFGRFVLNPVKADSADPTKLQQPASKCGHSPRMSEAGRPLRKRNKERQEKASANWKRPTKGCRRRDVRSPRDSCVSTFVGVCFHGSVSLLMFFGLLLRVHGVLSEKGG
jgi:hypothetical protein